MMTVVGVVMTVMTVTVIVGIVLIAVLDVGAFAMRRTAPMGSALTGKMLTR